MKVQSNSRQIPNTKSVTANKDYFDYLYSILQEMSHLEVTSDGRHIRYVDKKEATSTKLAELIRVKSRQTAATRLKKLIDLHLIEDDEVNGRYILTYLERSICTLVPQETLRKMNNALNRYSVSLFVYFMNRYLAAGEKEYIVTMTQMKEYIGIATSTSSNNQKIADIMEILAKLGLIKYEYRHQDGKTLIYITKVHNVIE